GCSRDGRWAGGSGADILDELEQRPSRPRRAEDGDTEDCVVDADEPLRVGVFLALGVDELESEVLHVPLGGPFGVGDGEGEVPDTKDHTAPRNLSIRWKSSSTGWSTPQP